MLFIGLPSYAFLGSCKFIIHPQAKLFVMDNDRKESLTDLCQVTIDK